MPRAAMPRTVEALMDRIEPEPNSGCWLWVGASYGRGYGGVRWGVTTRSGKARPAAAYRVLYEVFRGPIPPKYQIDHLCRNRRCVNPQHLDVVTCRENLRRGEGFIGHQIRRTHCPRGHSLVGENLNVRNGHRSCRACWITHKHDGYLRIMADPSRKAAYLEYRKLWKRAKKERLRAEKACPAL